MCASLNTNYTLPLVSIITPCFNVEKYIEDFLESIVVQSYDNIELILIDDGSTDQTATIIKNYEQRIKKRGYAFKYIYQSNNGQASALNKGLSLFNGEYFTWPDSDDVLAIDSVKKRIDYLLKNPSYGLVRGKRAFFRVNYEDYFFVDEYSNYYNEDIFYDLVMGKTFCSGGCYMMEKELFKLCYPGKKIYEGLGSQNWQLVVPASSRSKCGNIDDLVYYVRERKDSFSRRKRTLYEWFERCDDHKAILHDSFHHSNCDVKYCKQLVEAKYDQKKFNLCLSFNNKQKAIKYYKKLIRSNKFGIKSKLAFTLELNIHTRFILNKLKDVKTYLALASKKN